MKPPAFQPTEEQEAILRAAQNTSSSLMISAYAGTAKTTTIELLSPHLSSPSVLALAFNVKIKEELVKRLPKHFTIKTLNGLGHGAWGKAIGKRLTLDDRKLGKIISQVAKAQNLDLGKDGWAQTKDLCNAARLAGLVPRPFPHKGFLPNTEDSWLDLAHSCDIFSPKAELLSFAHSCLSTSVKQAFEGTIDFDDQIYMSVCYNGVFQKFHTVLVDEAQDLSILNHHMLKRSVAERLIVCGDPRQSLYAFRGAATGSMERIRALRPEWIDLPLTMTFRCPPAIVARQWHHAPGYKSAPGMTQGKVVDRQDGPWGPDIFPQEGSLAILCRNNAPLLSLAFKLFHKGISCQMLGRDLGKGMLGILKKLSLPADTKLADVTSLLQNSFEKEFSILQANGKDGAAERLSDRHESLLAVLEGSGAVTLQEAQGIIEELFSKTSAKVTLATAHRAKGLEWDHVIHLDPFRIPSRFAKGEEALLQEANAAYVLETRAKQSLTLALKDAFQ